MASQGLSLAVHDFESLARYRWVLTGPDGEELASHQVRLDARSPEFEAFLALSHHLRWRADPWARAEDEARIAGEIGHWIGTQVLGPVTGALAAATPATVRVIVPRAAEDLMFCPLELAHAGGRPLAAQEVVLVMQPADEALDAAGEYHAAPPSGRLRVLGLFSLPAGQRALNQRRERQDLLDVCKQVADAGRAIEARVLQYGVTRQQLRAALAEEGGWDIVHISGHGAPGRLLLEGEDGSPDAISAADLASLLRAARQRLSLVTLSACWSAAPGSAGSRLGLRAEGEAAGVAATADGWTGQREQENGLSDGRAMRAMASEIMSRLGCAVLAMRYPVSDEFATTLMQHVYQLMTGAGVPLPRALGTALKEIATATSDLPQPTLSVITPALFGAAAADLTLAAPSGSWLGPGSGRQPGVLPPQQARFVGRTEIMTRASAVLAPRSGWPGVLLHGMPGAGKTACALELAYTHEQAFDRMAWFEVPERGDQRSALMRFAGILETLLPGLRIEETLDNPSLLKAVLPELTEMMRNQRVLLIIDNVESLLTGAGQSQFQPWGQIITAIAAHDGVGKVVLTSRRRPEAPQLRLRTEAVSGLSQDETLVLLSELPRLRRMVYGQVADLAPSAARDLARKVLELSQGHPRILELADEQASALASIDEFITGADSAWNGAGDLQRGFLPPGHGQSPAEDFVHALGGWAQAVTTTLPARERELLGFLCCLQDVDRVRAVMKDTWVRERAGDPAGGQGELDDGLAGLVGSGLLSVLGSPHGRTARYRIHPVIVAAARGQVGGGDFRQRVDATLAEYWQRAYQSALATEGAGSTSRQVKSAAMAAVPYVLRQGMPAVALDLLDEVLLRDGSATTARATWPALRTVAAATSGASKARAIVALLNCLDAGGVIPADDELFTSELHAAAEEARATRRAASGEFTEPDYRARWALTSHSIKVDLSVGRYGGAMQSAEEQIALAEHMGMGPRTRLEAEIARLEVAAATGYHDDVLNDVARLRHQMDTLPVAPGQPETATPWRVRERLLIVGNHSAARTERWSEALRFNTELLASRRARGAENSDLGSALFERHGELIELGRIDEARAVLVECRALFEPHRDFHMLGLVLSALAQLEDRRGHPGVAVEMERSALRYKYLANDVEAIPISHYGLAYFSGRHFGRPGSATAHYLAAALIAHIVADPDVRAVNALALDLEEIGDLDAAPADAGELCRQVAEVPGADLADLLARICPGEGRAQEHFDGVLADARNRAAGVFSPAGGEAAPSELPRYFAMWDPVIAGIVAARDGDARARHALGQHLVKIQDAGTEWAPLARSLSMVSDGHGADAAAGLDDVGAAIIARALEALRGAMTMPADLWHVMPWGYTLADLVAGSRGDARAAAAAESELTTFAQRNPRAASMCAALMRVLAGDRDAGLASTLPSPVDRAVVTSVLQHVEAG
ncbi:MAG TPA: CHAT domain-containing protein [Streptosporangiaceae bacterium]|nr:CHAT domain-containing protein [Streptosporangiaceae bacterium]